MDQFFGGIFAALTTPLDGDRVLPEKLKENIRKYNREDLAGYVIAGSSGEAASLTDEEVERLVVAAVESAAEGKKILVGTGRESTSATISFTRRMASLGADAALVRPPGYFKSQMTTNALKKHFLELADASPIPIIPYHIPQVTGVTLEPELVVELSKHPRIPGMKDSSGDLVFLGGVIRSLKPGFCYLLGAGGLLFFGLLLGAAGGILRLADVVPGHCARLYRLFREGRWQDAAKLQRELLPLNTAITHTYGIPGAKYAAEVMGFYGGPPRPPLQSLDDREREHIESLLKGLKQAENRMENKRKETA